MGSAERPSFDPNQARGAAGASLFDFASRGDDEAEPSTSVPKSKDKSEGKKTSDAQGREPGAKNRPAERPLTVSEITDRIGRVLMEHLPRKVRVVGEISNLTRRNHWYFSLKDENAVLGCVAWASKARSFGFEAENGVEVVATGRIQFYSPQGRCQLYVDRMEPVGAGALELQFRALCAELKKLGYFDPARKKQPPVFPRRIAVVTSETGAALQDVLDTLRRRCPAVDVYLAAVRVQGAEAAGEVVRALRYLAKHHQRKRIDAVIITRGGGSMEDLWAFNERIVADALLDFPVPTIAAIGHETDTTIAELVADVRCATPTQAAMIVAPDRAELAVQLDHARRRMTQQIEQRMRLHHEQMRYAAVHLARPDELLKSVRERAVGALRHLTHAMERLIRNRHRRTDRAALAIERVRPWRLTAQRERSLELAHYRLHRGLRDRINASSQALETSAHRSAEVARAAQSSAESRLERVEALLHSIDPTRVLHRGYSITRRSHDGRIIKSTGEVKPGERITTNLADGEVRSDVVDESSEPATMDGRDASAGSAHDEGAGKASNPNESPRADSFDK